MKKALLLFLATVLCINLTRAQESGKYDLLFLSGTVQPVSNASKLAEQSINFREIVNGKYFRIIQFLEIPSDEEKKELQSKGVDLIGYMPNLAFFASIKETTKLESLNTRGNIRAVLQIAPEYKIHPSLKDNKLPEDAEVVPGKADLILTYFKGV